MTTQEFTVPFRCLMPALILHKRIVAAQVHGHRSAAMRTIWNQLLRNFHFGLYAFRQSQTVIFTNDIPLCAQHLAKQGFIVTVFLTAWFGALKQPVISLRVEQTLFLKPGFLEAIVYVGGQDKVIFVLYHLE